VNIRNISALRGIQDTGNGLTIGALATLAEVTDHRVIREKYKILSDPCGTAATPHIRNMATLGGNLLQPVQCWYYRSPEFQCLRKGKEFCFAFGGLNQYHAIIGLRQLPFRGAIISCRGAARAQREHRADLREERHADPRRQGLLCPTGCESEQVHAHSARRVAHVHHHPEAGARHALRLSKVRRETPADLELVDDEVRSKSAKMQPISFKRAAAKMKADQITAQSKRVPDYDRSKYLTYAGVDVAEVEVDIEVGRIRVKRVLSVHDCGRPMNPTQVMSQINGGIVQGISYTLFENRLLDPAHGLMVNPNLEMYKITGSHETPDIDVRLVEAYIGQSSTDASGIGEAAGVVSIGAAIANAAYNAIAVRIRQTPMTPAVVLAALNRPALPRQALSPGEAACFDVTAGVSRVTGAFLCMHVVTNTPAGPMEAVRSYSSISGGLPHLHGGSAPALGVSRPAWCSLTLQPTCSRTRFNGSLDRRLRRLRYVCRRFACYRVERTSSRAGLNPAEKHRLSRRTCRASLGIFAFLWYWHLWLLS
jgi:hypothetical protein